MEQNADDKLGPFTNRAGWDPTREVTLFKNNQAAWWKPWIPKVITARRWRKIDRAGLFIYKWVLADGREYSD